MMKKFYILVFVLILSIMFVSCGQDEITQTSDKPQVADGTSTEETTEAERLLYEDDIIKVSFIGIFEEPSIQGACYMRLRVENKSEQEISVYTTDSYVNDMSVMIGSGVHMALAGGKQSQNPFFFSYGNLDITGKDEIEKIEFKFLILDENSATLEKTENIIIDIK